MAGKHRGEPSGPEVTLQLQERRVRLSEQREARFARAQAQREERQAASQAASQAGQGRDWRKDWGQARTAARAPGRAARAVTQRSGTYSGKGMLAGLLLVGFIIVAIRMVADAEVADDGTAVKAKVLHPAGQLGPVPILAALIATFFVLSFVAMGGGTRAKLAVIMGGAIVLTLGVRSLNEFKFVAATFGRIGTITAPAPSGQLGDIYGNAGSGGTPGFANMNTPLQQVAASNNNAAQFGLQSVIPPAAYGSFLVGLGSLVTKGQNDVSSAASKLANLLGL